MRQGPQQDAWGLSSRPRGGGSGGWIPTGLPKVWLCVQTQTEDGLASPWSGRFQGSRKPHNLAQHSVCVIGHELGPRWAVSASTRGGKRSTCGLALGSQMLDPGGCIGFKPDQVCLLWWFKKQELLTKLAIEVLFLSVLVQWVEVLGTFPPGHRAENSGRTTGTPSSHQSHLKERIWDADRGAWWRPGLLSACPPFPSHGNPVG